jgi:hypothetical protein
VREALCSSTLSSDLIRLSMMFLVPYTPALLNETIAVALRNLSAALVCIERKSHSGPS